MQESKRIFNFKNKLIKELPFFPNNNETLKDLKSQGLNEILIHYLHWKSRIIPARPRAVMLSASITADKRWKFLKSEVKLFLDKIRIGEDVTPYISSRVRSHGYTPRSRIRNGEASSWDDKDQLLNTKGFHHFHLDMRVQNSGLSNRTADVLFARVSRDKFLALGIFDHSVFEPSTGDLMTSERERMWRLHEQHEQFGMIPGTIYMSNPIATSGHPIHIVTMGDYYASLIREIDTKLVDRVYVNSIYEQASITPPAKFEFEWRLDGLDLIAFDKKTSISFRIHSGFL